MPISKIKTGSITADSITEAKIADAAVENEHLNSNVITGQSEISEKGAVDDVLLVFDASTGTLKKITAANINLGTPTITSITPTNVDSKDSATTTTFTVTGTNFFTGTTAKLISNSASDISFTTLTRDSTTQLTCVLNNSLITLNTDEPYDIFVNNGVGTTTLTNQIFVDQRPVFITAAGSLGNVTESQSASFTIEATDPESAGAVRFDLVAGTLPSGLSLNTATGAITGTAPSVASDTTSTFTIQASDVDSNVSLREFSITVAAEVFLSFTTSGTFSVPVGVTTVDVLVVAGGGASGGGGGGAGGLIFRPAFTVTPGGTVSVTVGEGGLRGPGPGDDFTDRRGQDSVFGTLTAKGGGAGGDNYTQVAAPAAPGFTAVTNIGFMAGGSGGGGGYRAFNFTSAGTQGASATQPTQPGDSGTYGFGSGGGTGGPAGWGGEPGVEVTMGGGGGAGAVGTGSSPGPRGGEGGIGKAYTIADGTTPVYYAGGGGGASFGAGQGGGFGGQGGGGNAGKGDPGPVLGQTGQANKGGGGGGFSTNTPIPALPATSVIGGKGIVIVKY